MRSQADKYFTMLGYTKIDDCRYIATNADEYECFACIDLDLDNLQFIKYIKKTIDGKQVSIADWCTEGEMIAIQEKFNEYAHKNY